MPDTVKFLLVLLCLGGAIYGGVWALANFPPEQAEVVKPLSSEKLRAK
ncbi:histidine kinase [Aestuariivirga sp.]